MTRQDLSKAKNPDLRASLAAMRRAAEMARSTAIQTNTEIVIVKDCKPVRVTAEELRETFNTNVIGPVLLTQALLPLLDAGKPARVINVSSQLGSVANMSDGWPGYGISKAALNAATRKFAAALESRGISVNAASPGWVKTDMGTEDAPLSLEQGGHNIARLVTDFPAGTTNKFLQEHGEYPW